MTLYINLSYDCFNSILSGWIYLKYTTKLCWETWVYRTMKWVIFDSLVLKTQCKNA